jgi:hypothetical protein
LYASSLSIVTQIPTTYQSGYYSTPPQFRLLRQEFLHPTLYDFNQVVYSVVNLAGGYQRG